MYAHTQRVGTNDAGDKVIKLYAQVEERETSTTAMYQMMSFICERTSANSYMFRQIFFFSLRKSWFCSFTVQFSFLYFKLQHDCLYLFVSDVVCACVSFSPFLLFARSLSRVCRLDKKYLIYRMALTRLFRVLFY